MIEFQDISFGYSGSKPLFKDLSFRLECNGEVGKVVALMGPSGVGKSSMIKLISGILEPTNGNIEIRPKNLPISFLPQEPVLFDHLSAGENARYFQRIRKYRPLFDETRFNRLCSKLNMTALVNGTRSITELSGGQQQRISLLRALSIQPKVMLLDEPTKGLDSDVKHRFLTELRDLVCTEGILAIYVTHDRWEAELLADEVMYLSKEEEAPIDVHWDTLQNLSERPPIIQIAKAFSYPFDSTIRCRIDGNKLALAKREENHSYLTFDNANCHLSEQGFQIVSITNSGRYSYLRLVNGDRIHAKLPKEGSGMALVVNGDACIFNKQGRLMNKVKLVENEIIAE